MDWRLTDVSQIASFTNNQKFWEALAAELPLWLPLRPSGLGDGWQSWKQFIPEYLGTFGVSVVQTNQPYRNSSTPNKEHAGCSPGRADGEGPCEKASFL
jgi:hypothetical protein